jgi:hypothetical protein
MPANNEPIYSRVPDIQYAVALLTANTAVDGTGTVTTVFTADATNGGYVDRVRFKPAGTNIATVVRLFINNGSTNATASNNSFWDEIVLPATTASNTAVIGPAMEFGLGFPLPAGYKLNIALGTAVAAGWNSCAIGGKY